MSTNSTTQYRNYHARVVSSDGTVSTISVFGGDAGPGTKRAIRELLRRELCAKSVRLHTGRVVDAPRKGCTTFSLTAVKKERTRLNKARKAANTAKAA